ncbi:MAG: hypothetical protein ACRDAM_14670 [Casimicrobium sp.]
MKNFSQLFSKPAYVQTKRIVSESYSLDEETPFVDANDALTARNVAEALNKHYPGHLWAVDIPPHQGVINVRDLMLAGNWGFRILKTQWATVSELEKLAMRYGGELLERYKVSRSKLNHDEIDSLATDFAGRHIILN